MSRKEKFYRNEEVSFLVTVPMEVDEHANTPDYRAIQVIVRTAVNDALDDEKLDGVEFAPADVRMIEPA